MKKFNGVFISLLTPMTSDYEVDYKRLSEICEWLIGKGINGLIPAGPLGEDTTLSDEERKNIIETVIKTSNGRVPIIAGAGATATKDVIDWAEFAKSSGADGILVVPPILTSEDEMIAHFQAVSTVDIPIIVFNNPRDLNIDLTTDILIKISESSNLVGISDFSQDIRRVNEIIEKTDLEVFISVDDLAMEGAICGASGWTSGVSNALPEEGVKLFQLAKEGKIEEARRLYQTLLPLYYYDTIPQLFQAIKYMMELAGQPVGPTRPPRLPLSDDTYRNIKEEFEKVENTFLATKK